MITINKNKYAKNEKEFINSLANENGTCSGYYKRYKRKINLLNKDKILIGVINKYGVIMFIPKIENKINYPYLERYKDIQRVAIKHEFIKRESIYTFKL